MNQSILIKLVPVLVGIALFLLPSCGTTGRIACYDFKVSKDSLELAVNRFLTKHEGYQFPKNDTTWRAYTPKDSVIDYQLIDGVMHHHYKSLKNTMVYLYFEKGPEEVYELRYSMDKAYWDNHPFSSRLALVSVMEKGGRWRHSDPIFNSFFRGRKRVEKRLEEEILNKLPHPYEKIK
ncbi:MAG: hypothetical protein K0S23_347 [Fluviicola sp.]|jgi:hypothetical protein|uniref:hypothetical protein n=1 Tax=Fluviicola sp. TaxID=1917219 RepID=UPI002619935F|nr:hypothetical protein [Fluviicola sp.]MDF3026040.1 hypothetical protein [Fluviicola sp.]